MDHPKANTNQASLTPRKVAVHTSQNIKSYRPKHSTDKFAHRFEEWESAVPPSLPLEALQTGELVRDVLPQPVDNAPYCTAGCSNPSRITNAIAINNTSTELQDLPTKNTPSTSISCTSQFLTPNSDPASICSIRESIKHTIASSYTKNSPPSDESFVNEKLKQPLRRKYRRENQNIPEMCGETDSNPNHHLLGEGSVNPRQILAPALTPDVPSSWTEPVAAVGAGN